MASKKKDELPAESPTPDDGMGDPQEQGQLADGPEQGQENINPFSDNFDPSLVGLPAGEDEEFEEDFTDVQDGFALIDEGIFPLKCIDFDKTESKSGNPQYEWEFIFVGGQFDGRKKKVWASLVPAARWKVAAHLKAFGIDAAGSIVRFKKSDMVGKMVMGEVRHEPDYQGKTDPRTGEIIMRDKIDNLFPYDGPTDSGLPADPSDLFADQ